MRRVLACRRGRGFGSRGTDNRKPTLRSDESRDRRTFCSLHAEYRSWCKYCVHGKGISRQHAAGDPTEEALGVTISIDYCFMLPEESEEEMDAILIAHDSQKMGLWAMTADANGPTPQAVGWLSGKIEESGYNGVKMTMKSDQEN